jgi:hypothetical protein
MQAVFFVAKNSKHLMQIAITSKPPLSQREISTQSFEQRNNVSLLEYLCLNQL